MHPEVPDDIHFTYEVAAEVSRFYMIEKKMSTRLQGTIGPGRSLARDLLATHFPFVSSRDPTRYSLREFQAKSIGMLNNNYVFDDGSVLLFSSYRESPTASGPDMIDLDDMHFIHEVTRRRNAELLPKKDLILRWIDRMLNKGPDPMTELHARPRPRG